MHIFSSTTRIVGRARRSACLRPAGQTVRRLTMAFTQKTIDELGALIKRPALTYVHVLGHARSGDLRGARRRGADNDAPMRRSDPKLSRAPADAAEDGFGWGSFSRLRRDRCVCVQSC